MTQEIKLKLEQAADKRYHPASDHREHYVAGAQAILDNPGEWGLVDEKLFRSTSNSCESWANKWAEKSEKCRELQSQLTKYREALERVRKIVIYDLSEPIQEVIDVVEGVLYEGE